MIERFDHRPGRRVACRYGDTVGVPAIFEATLFPRLLRIEGDRGAKSLLTESPADLVTVDWPEGVLDIDRPRDLD
jgi:molybdenum cofactor cytidylyltransferase